MLMEIHIELTQIEHMSYLLCLEYACVLNKALSHSFIGVQIIRIPRVLQTFNISVNPKLFSISTDFALSKIAKHKSK